MLNEISPAQLNRLIGVPGAPTIVDLRVDEDFIPSPRLIPGAFRHGHKDLDGLQQQLGLRRAQRVVVVCHKGRKISQGVAAHLRADGIAAEVLSGGYVAWEAARFPSIDTAQSLIQLGGEPTLWVTRHRPKIDRVASPWLIRRFIDPLAKFLFVPPQDVSMVAERFGAIPFDTEGAELGHHGEKCTFDAVMNAVGLRSDALEHMAQVVRGADTDRHDLAPQCAGVLALGVGLSRIYRDDTAQVEAGLLIWDALYRWARDGMDEIHEHVSPENSGQLIK